MAFKTLDKINTLNKQKSGYSTEEIPVLSKDVITFNYDSLKVEDKPKELNISKTQEQIEFEKFKQLKAELGEDKINQILNNSIIINKPINNILKPNKTLIKFFKSILNLIRKILLTPIEIVIILLLGLSFILYILISYSKYGKAADNKIQTFVNNLAIKIK